MAVFVRDYDDIVTELRRSKMIAKSAFTKAKNKLESLIDEVGFPARKDVRAYIDKVNDCQSKAIDIIIELSRVYQETGDKHSMKTVIDEATQVENYGNEVQERAQDYLRDRSDASSTNSGKTGVSKLFHSQRSGEGHESLERRSNEESLQTRSEVKHSESIKTPEGPTSKTNKTNPDRHANERNRHRRFPNEPVPDFDNYRNDNPVGSGYSLGKDMWAQLKRVSIPVFSGDAKSYEGWKAAFMACIDNAPATPEYKLLQLRQYLVGDVLQVVRDLGHSASAYDVALQRLDRKYGGKRRQVALQLEAITSFKPIRPGNANDVEHFADLLDIVVVNLRESDKVEELGDGLLFSQLLQKMTEPMVANYHRWIFENQRQGSVESLREWVLQEAEFQIIACETIHGISYKNKGSAGKGLSTSGSFFGNRQCSDEGPCPVCKTESHAAYRCETFKSMAIPDRWEVARKSSLCYRCLEQGHMAKTCTRRVGMMMVMIPHMFQGSLRVKVTTQI